MLASDWMGHEGIATTHNEAVITSQPCLIRHEDGKLYAGWEWSDGIKTFAHNTAGNAFTLEEERITTAAELLREEAKRLGLTPCMSPLDQHQDGCSCRECDPPDVLDYQQGD